MKCIIGLGNPGKEFALTRHNVGFIAVEYLVKNWGFEGFTLSKKHEALIAVGQPWDEKILVIMPQTYMNLSGKSVASIINFYGLVPADILIISDDIDMDLGKVRYRANGSSGGQNGLKSIAECLGTTEFARIKIGIGRDSRYEVSDWVLSKFQTEELKSLDETLEIVKSRAQEWLKI